MIQATLLLALACGVANALSRRSAAERHVFWAAVLGAAALLPPGSVLLGAWQPAWARAVADIVPAIVRASPPGVSAYGADIVVHAGALEDTGSPLLWVIAVVWGLGALAALGILATGAFRLSQLKRLGRPVTDRSWLGLAANVSYRLRIRRPVSLLQSPAVHVPMTWGLLRPRIVLPLAAVQWPDDRREAVLTHELAHVRRGDWLVQILAEVACALYWFHPLFWLAYRRLRSESEHACDDVVVSGGIDAPDYAAHLLQVVRAARGENQLWHSPLTMGRPSQLERRFAALLVPEANRRPVGGWRVAAILALAAASVIPLSAIGVSPVLDATINVQTASLPRALDAPLSAAEEHPAPPILRVRTVAAVAPGLAVGTPEVVEYTTPPLYSDEARRRRIEGVVTLAARIDTDGRVTATRVVSGLGFGLDQNALVALRQWRFRPGTRGGKPVDVEAEIDVEFSLRNEVLNELIANDMATRIGPDVTAPRIIRRVNVPSVDEPRGDRPAGTVVLDVVLLEDGRPKIVRLLQSVAPRLDERAIDAFEQWRFSPAMKAGRPVKVRLQAEITFH